MIKFQLTKWLIIDQWLIIDEWLIIDLWWIIDQWLMNGPVERSRTSRVRVIAPITNDRHESSCVSSDDMRSAAAARLHNVTNVSVQSCCACSVAQLETSTFTTTNHLNKTYPSD